MPLLYSNTVIVINPNDADRMANSVDPDLTDCTFRSNLIFVYTVCWDLHVSVWTLRIVRTSATFSSHLFSWSCNLASYALWNAVTADIDKSETFSGKWSPSSPTPLWNNLSQSITKPTKSHVLLIKTQISCASRHFDPCLYLVLGPQSSYQRLMKLCGSAGSPECLLGPGIIV